MNAKGERSPSIIGSYQKIGTSSNFSKRNDPLLLERCECSASLFDCILDILVSLVN